VDLCSHDPDPCVTRQLMAGTVKNCLSNSLLITSQEEGAYFFSCRSATLQSPRPGLIWKSVGDQDEFTCIKCYIKLI
jgi:hypothetical protein